MSEVWEVLDAEFAQEQEVINAVNMELYKLRLSECSIPEHRIMLRNYLPTLEEALKARGGVGGQILDFGYLCAQFYCALCDGSKNVQF